MISSPMPRAVRFMGMLGAIVLACSTCGSSGSPGPQSPSAGGAVSSPSVIASPVPIAPSSAPPSTEAIDRNPAAFVEGQPYSVKVDPADFVAVVDNSFMPLTPGTTFSYEGAERIEVTVMDETKTILGVPTTVVRDRVFERGALVEDTLDWYAQDGHGNVWYFGEQTAEYKDGKIVSTSGSWEAGVDGAQPGIIMLAEPQAGDAYRQEYYAGEAEDLAEVIGPGQAITVPFDEFDATLVTEEWTPLEPAIRERKTYARGVGLVEARTIKGGDDVVQLAELRPGA